jgi:aspartate/tyrosine/aromatic aminotransferase
MVQQHVLGGDSADWAQLMDILRSRQLIAFVDTARYHGYGGDMSISIACFGK